MDYIDTQYVLKQYLRQCAFIESIDESIELENLIDHINLSKSY